ncbi:hypothetical protein ABZZ16_29080, partial [Streptomyces sp. NPDC006386]
APGTRPGRDRVPRGRGPAPAAQAQLNRRTAEQVVEEILQRTPVPAAPQQQSGFGAVGRTAPAYPSHPPRRL